MAILIGAIMGTLTGVLFFVGYFLGYDAGCKETAQFAQEQLDQIFK
jgi:hypothetical protein